MLFFLLILNCSCISFQFLIFFQFKISLFFHLKFAERISSYLTCQHFFFILFVLPHFDSLLWLDIIFSSLYRRQIFCFLTDFSFIFFQSFDVSYTDLILFPYERRIIFSFFSALVHYFFIFKILRQFLFSYWLFIIFFQSLVSFLSTNLLLTLDSFSFVRHVGKYFSLFSALVHIFFFYVFLSTTNFLLFSSCLFFLFFLVDESAYCYWLLINFASLMLFSLFVFIFPLFFGFLANLFLMAFSFISCCALSNYFRTFAIIF